MWALSIKDLNVTYGRGDCAVTPVDGLDLEVSAGALAVLLGPSGCGKTTLLSCLSGIQRPTSGMIRFGDVEVTGLHGAELDAYRRHTVGIVFQAFNLVASLDAAENVMIPLRTAGMKRGTRRRERGRCSTRWDCSSGRIIVPRTCRVVSNSASRSRSRVGARSADDRRR